MTDDLNPPASFTTARLRLREPSFDDAAALFRAYTSDPDAARFTSWRPHQNVEETRDFLRRCAEERSAGTDYHYVIEVSGERIGPIGIISFHILGSRVSFGYVLAASRWGRGYTSEALTALVDWALAQPKVWRAFAFCDVENKGSARVMEKAGMSFEGILRRYFVHPNISPDPRDCRIYAKVRD